MRLKNTFDHYGLVAILIHWTVAMLVIGMLTLGFYMGSLTLGPQKVRWVGIHKEFGLLILFLATFRILWRFINIEPNLPVVMPRWQIFAARAVHWLLLILLIAMPLTGWLLSSAAARNPSFFGLFVMPPLISPNEYLKAFFAETHEVIAYTLIIVISGHAFAALYHHYIDKDDVLRRMLP